MLTYGQFGLRKGKSCVTNLLRYYDRVGETMQEKDGRKKERKPQWKKANIVPLYKK